MQKVNMFRLTEMIELLSIDTTMQNSLFRIAICTFQETARSVH